MATRSFFWLMLLRFFGLVCGAEIKIDVGYTYKSLRENKNDKKPLPFSVIYNRGSTTFQSEIIEIKKSDLVCVKTNFIFTIKFKFNVSGQKELKLSTATDSENYQRQENLISDVILPWKHDTEELCFLTGIWESKSGNQIEIYLNFISKKDSYEGNRLIYLQIVLKPEKIDSRMIIKAKETRLYGTYISKRYNSRKDSYKYLNVKKTVDSIIEECDVDERAIVGNIDYSIKNYNSVEFKYGKRSMTLIKGDELNMAFLSKMKMESDDLTEAMLKFDNEGPTKSITTPWAEMTRTDNVIEFTLLGNRRLLSEGAGKSGFSLNNPYLVI